MKNGGEIKILHSECKKLPKSCCFTLNILEPTGKIFNPLLPIAEKKRKEKTGSMPAANRTAISFIAMKFLMAFNSTSLVLTLI